MLPPGLEEDVTRLAHRMRRAAESGVFSGRMTLQAHAYMSRCTLRHDASGALVILTRDSGHHTSGWMKNPDYERCLHLSISPISRVIIPGSTRELSRPFLRVWLQAIFGEDLRHVWAESPKSRAGHEAGVWHWRLFCDERWQPIHPRGEVYSTEFTEIGWKSASEIFELTGRPEPLSTVNPN